MTLGATTFDVASGDTACIAPGLLHQVENTGTAALTVLCMCSPADSHADTELSEHEGPPAQADIK